MLTARPLPSMPKIPVLLCTDCRLPWKEAVKLVGPDTPPRHDVWRCEPPEYRAPTMQARVWLCQTPPTGINLDFFRLYKGVHPRLLLEAVMEIQQNDAYAALLNEPQLTFVSPALWPHSVPERGRTLSTMSMYYAVFRYGKRWVCAALPCLSVSPSVHSWYVVQHR